MPPTPAIKPGVIKDPAIAALFSNKDPEQRYDDLKEIGHGSFGAVYYAFDKERSETVAIKKMSYTGKQAAEKWTDILKEVSFLNKIHHKHIVSYKSCYLKEHTCWLVMEYCIGSASDIVDVLKKGLREVEIGVICTQVLDALEYLHSLNRIHRDIKAGNILLSDQALVKLADFGSAALTDPASTFIGTPYFMAPEVIMSMDEGNYNHKADIWSLGITCIELAERKPPLFNMHTMSALYHIAQNDPPTLAPVPDGQYPWSNDFISFVDNCLQKDPEDRRTAKECMNHPFIRTIRPRDTIQEMINRTKNMVVELDNFQYRKMRKLMYLDEPESINTDSTQGSHDDDILDDIQTSVDVLSVGKCNDSASSRSASLKSLTSYRSMQSSNGPGGNRRPPIPSSMIQESKGEENRTLIPVGDPADSEKDEEIIRSNSPLPKIERNIKEDVQTLRKSKFATLRSAKLISKEQEEYSKENNMYEQLSGYKRLRQQHHKELQSLEERCAVDMEMLRIRLDKELEQLQSSNGKERQRTKVVHQSEMEKKKKEVDDGEKKLRKQLTTRQQREMQAFSAQQLKEYKHNKELAKSSLKQHGLSRAAYEQAVKETKSNLNRIKQQAESNFDAKLRSEFDLEMIRYKRTQLARTHSLEEKLEEEEMNAQERHMEAVQSLLLRHHETTKEMERSHQWELHAMKKKHQEKQHEAELMNQIEYNRRQTEELQKKHALQSRQQPRELKLKEAQIRKQYRQAVKTQTRQFKLWQTQLLQAAPREEQKEIATRLKDEQKRKIALLASQYEHQIENMVQEKTVKLESWQEDEDKNLAEKLSKELEELKAYQTRQRQMTDTVIAKEKSTLAEKINVRHVLLLQKFDEERQELARLRDAKRQVLTERHERERRDLDAKADAYTTSL